MPLLAPEHSTRVDAAVSLVFLVFLGLKLTGDLSWSWWWVLSPLIAWCAARLVL